MYRKFLAIVIMVAPTAMNASAGTIFDTLPSDDHAGLGADCGQTWMTGSLGVVNQLETIEVANRSSGAGGGDVYLAVYENNAVSGSEANWVKGNLVAISSNTQDMGVNGAVNTFNYNYETLSDNTRYLYTFVDASTNGVSVGTGIRQDTGDAEQSVYTGGGIAFSGAHTIASRITTISTLPLTYQSATTLQTNSTIPKVGIHGVAALEITSVGGIPTNSVTSLTYNLNGTTDPSDIEEVRLYEGESAFDLESAALLATLATPTGTFSFDQPVTTEKQSLWLAVKLRGSSSSNDLVDVEITEFTLAGADAGTYVPTVTAPPEFLTVDVNKLYSMVLRRRGLEGYADGFRIPGLAVTTNGTLIASFDARIDVGDLPGDMDVGIMRSFDGGITWEPMQLIMDYDASVPGSIGNGVGDPTILVDPVNGRIWVAALWSFGNNGWFGSGPGLDPVDTGQYVLSYSDDDGATWSEPVSITSQIKEYAWRLYFNGPGKGICTSDGILVFPSQFKDASAVARSNFIWSDDRGATWNHGDPAVPSGSPQTSESQIIELANGDLMLSMRDESKPGKRLWCIYSWDHATETIADGSWGPTWQDLDDPTVMASIERYSSSIGDYPWTGLLFSNPDNPGSRVDMTVRLSLDEGAPGSWTYKRKIDDRFAAYSCLAILPDGDIGLLYETTDGAPTMEFVRFPLEWLVGTEDSNGDGTTDFEEDVLSRKKTGIEASFGTTDERYLQEVYPDTEGTNVLSGTAWRGERYNAQVVLWAWDATDGVSVSSTPMDNGQGTSFDILPQFVKYSVADDGGNACGDNRTRPTTLQPDAIDTDTSPLSITNQTAQPVWVTVDVPTNAPAGNYQSTITVTGTGIDLIELTLDLEVLDAILPPPSDWSFHLDLWQNPWAIARYHGLTVWSQAHKDAISAQLELLANAGQKVVTTTLVHQPWGGQTYDAFESLIEWTKNSDGTWTYDFTRFDEYVELAEAAGIDEQINCYSMVAWSDLYRYYDAATSTNITLTLTPGSQAYTDHWTPFLQAFRAHLITKGWIDRTVIAMDERPEAVMLAAVALVKAVAPELKVAAAGHFHASLEPDLYDFSIHGGLIDGQVLSVLQARKAAGKKTTFYGSCDIAAPNMFTYSPPVEIAWYGWYAAAAGFDGTLRWAYNSWVEDPLADTRHSRFPAGDCFQVYPGPRSSIRFESLRDGIEEFEKIQILEETLTGQNLQSLQDILDGLNTGFFSSGTSASLLIPQAREDVAILASGRDLPATPIDFGSLHLEGGDDGDYTQCAGWIYGPAPAGANVGDDSADGTAHAPSFWAGSGYGMTGTSDGDVLAAGDYSINFIAAQTVGASTLTAEVFGWDGATQTSLGSTTLTPGAWTTGKLSFSIAEGSPSIGDQLQLEFSNSGPAGSWVGWDTISGEFTASTIDTPNPATLTIESIAGSVTVGATNLSATAINNLQVKTDLSDSSWSNLHSVTGVTQTNWVLEITNQGFFRVESTY